MIGVKIKGFRILRFLCERTKGLPHFYASGITFGERLKIYYQ